MVNKTKKGKQKSAYKATPSTWQLSQASASSNRFSLIRTRSNSNSSNASLKRSRKPDSGKGDSPECKFKSDPKHLVNMERDELEKLIEGKLEQFFTANFADMAKQIGKAIFLECVQPALERMDTEIANLNSRLDSFQKESIQKHFELIEEKDKRDSKKPNFVVYGLKETEKSDLSVIKELYEKSGQDPDTVKAVFRMGDPNKSKVNPRTQLAYPRLLKVIGSSIDAKKAVISYAKQTRLKQISEFSGDSNMNCYLRDDLTQMQMSVYSNAKSEAWKLNQELGPNSSDKYIVVAYQTLKKVKKL